MKQTINLILILLLPVIFKGSIGVQSQVVLFAPVLVAPEHKSSSLLPPDTFVWNGVEAADAYSIQITTDVTFLNINNSSDLDIASHSDTMYLPPPDFLQKDTMYFWRVKANTAAGAESDWSFIQMFITGVVGIDDLYSDKGITLSPVPAQNTVNVDFSQNYVGLPLKIFVFNGAGIMVDSITNIGSINNDKVELNTSTYPAGNYYFVFYVDDRIVGAKSVPISR